MPKFQYLFSGGMKSLVYCFTLSFSPDLFVTFSMFAGVCVSMRLCGACG